VDAQAVLNPRFSSTQAWIASYFLLNCRASYRVRIVSSLASELFVAVENLTNTAYEYRPGYPMAGRMLSGGLDLRF
jgi:outer membrane receptor protein involved in Fe transport